MKDQFDSWRPNDDWMFKTLEDAVDQEDKSVCRFFFTFGSEGQIYSGGWIIVHADTIREAHDKFIKHYGEKAWKSPGILNYAFHYSEEEFKETSMWADGNYGDECHEVIE